METEEKNKLYLGYLRQRQIIPLPQKINASKSRIEAYYEHCYKKNVDVFVSFSGGKDSTVLLDLVRSRYPDVPAVFVDTGLEYPEIKNFVKTIDNVTILKPEINFRQVIKKYGYPAISKDIARRIHDLQNPKPENKKTRHLFATGELNYFKNEKRCNAFKLPNKWKALFQVVYDDKIGWYAKNTDIKISDICCNIMKKAPIKKYIRETGRQQIVGTMADDSQQRKISYLKTGCNTFKGAIKSRPISFWVEKDIWNYIKLKNLPYCSIYDKGVHHTGCVFCMFGVHLEKYPNRFQHMKHTHPQLHNYCINKLQLNKVLDLLDVPYDDETETIEDYL